MSRYEKGDKVVYEVKEIIRDGVFILSGSEESKPLSAYTEPLEARIRRQAERIRRLLAENKGLKERVKELSKQRSCDSCNTEEGFETGAEQAWKLARKIVLMDYEGGYTDKELTEIFGTGNDYHVFNWNLTYSEAVQKVAEWEKNQEICVGDVVKSIYTSTPDYGLVIRTSEICVKGIMSDGTPFEWLKESCKKTGRHIDVSAMLAHIGGESDE